MKIQRLETKTQLLSKQCLVKVYAKMDRMPASVKRHEMQFVFLHSTAIKNDFNLYNCITFDCCKFTEFSYQFFFSFFVCVCVLLYRTPKRRRKVFERLLKWNVSLMANARGSTIRYVPADRVHLESDSFEKRKHLSIFFNGFNATKSC